MRIDLYNSAASQIANEPSSQQIAANKASSSTSATGGEDRATLTSDKSSVSALVSTAMGSPEIRQSLVSSLRDSVNNGTYSLDPGKIAASMVDDHA